ncbi:MAG: hypothetical protein GWO24_37450, partial [Akkermansiaceae bacterium]|nr:hypothetical protein [Akkermansiaceae bacterium]
MRGWGWFILFLYVVLLVVSHLYLSMGGEPASDSRRGSGKQYVQLGQRKLAYLEWGGADAKLPPLILLH